MTLSAIHNLPTGATRRPTVVCDIGGYDFVSYSQHRLLFCVPANSCL